MEFDPSAYTPIEALSLLDKTATGVAFATNTGDILEITSYGEGIVRPRIGPMVKPDYGLITARGQRCEIATASPGVWTLTTGNSEFELTGKPLALRLRVDQRQAIVSATDQLRNGLARFPALGRDRSGRRWLATLALASGEPVYGFGEQFGPLNKRGQWIERMPAGTRGSSDRSIPFCWSPGVSASNKSAAWGVLVNTPAKVTHAVGDPAWSHRSCAILVEDHALDLVFFASSTPAKVLSQYAELTGRPEGVPLWSLGLWVSRSGYRQPEQVARVAAKLRVRKIPFDTLMLDAESAWVLRTQFDFEWDSKRYPDPKQVLAAMKRQAPHLSVWEYPYVSIESSMFHDLAAKRYLLGNEHGEPYIFDWHVQATADSSRAGLETPSQSGMVDFTNPAAYAWWRDAHEALFAAGIDAIECDIVQALPPDALASNGDSGERLNTIYPLLHQQCALDAAAKFAPSSSGKPVVWGHASWIGSQRIPVQGIGAVQSDWEGLAATVRGALSLGMSGIPYCGISIGDIYGSSPPDDELYLRWLQLAVFSSHLRMNGDEVREPWGLGEASEPIARTWLQFRYRLLPYLQSVIAQAMASGLPVMRAMPLAFPNNALTRGYETQFMFGDALLVAAVIRPEGEVEVALPPGAWYDLSSRQRISGRQVIRYRAPLDRFPVFGREGYILPLGPVVQHSGEIKQAAPIEELWVFGKPTQALAGFTQAELVLPGSEAEQKGIELRTASGVKVEVFGEAPSLTLRTLA